MIEKLAVDLVSQMVEAKLIDMEMETRYVYTLVCWLEKFITVGTVIFISAAMKKLLPTLFFLIFFLGLRRRTGGFHLSRFYQCYFATIASYLMIVIVSAGLAKHPQGLFGILLLAMVGIGLIGTVNHPEMHMTPKELAESKNIARIIVMLEGSIICGSALFGAEMIFISYMAMAVILCAVLLCIAKIFKQEVKENDEDS